MWAIWTRPGELFHLASRSKHEPPAAEIVSWAVILPSVLQFWAVVPAVGWWRGLLGPVVDVIVASVSILVQVPLLMLVGRRMGWETDLAGAFRPYGLTWAVNIPGFILMDLARGLGGLTGYYVALIGYSVWYWWVMATAVREYSGLSARQSWLTVLPVIVTDVLLSVAIYFVSSWLWPAPPGA